ncbi:hypothetical protein CONLIGDRAFT_683831 [Coniochaeta ligniaria NRRL 30616]|uniref:Uncharacterized protein n=1 Tax=Coniochaeta ligniaria NRRL 30616 TaxID=1408157 RepID=A0A1J7JGX6_9PEZI|nr:hypothetical protein CONLIGDRAFT_683831 [Coniochaeta ligniaria NRRL 30616]
MGAYTHRRLRAALVFILRPLSLAVLLTLVCRLLFSSSPFPTPKTTSLPPSPKPPTKALVLASTSTLPPSDTAWLSSIPPSWSIHLYNTDLPGVVPIQKGNEAMPYLTYIIDHYASLPDIIFFHHSHATSWHQSLSSLDEVLLLRPQYIQKTGYASPRCLPGCENLIPIADYAVDFDLFHRVGRDVQLASLFDEFVNRSAGERVPERIAAPCCAQFVVTRERVLRRGREWWVRLREWLVATPLGDLESGRLLEWTWHFWMGAGEEFCPEERACRCHLFGIGECEEFFELEGGMGG